MTTAPQALPADPRADAKLVNAKLRLMKHQQEVAALNAAKERAARNPEICRARGMELLTIIAENEAENAFARLGAIRQAMEMRGELKPSDQDQFRAILAPLSVAVETLLRRHGLRPKNVGAELQELFDAALRNTDQTNPPAPGDAIEVPVVTVNEMSHQTTPTKAQPSKPTKPTARRRPE